MSNNELISVIVPVYKVEEYLKKCVDSIINQTYSNLEIILVDDGSPDNCGKICDEYAKSDARVKVIHKENGGLSSARNAGLDVAKGEYISFVDSDDMIKESFIEVLYKLCIDNKCDISECGYLRFQSEDELLNKNKATASIKVYSNYEMQKKIYDEECVKTVVVWNKLYKKYIYEKMRFPFGKIHEDEYTTYKAFFVSKTNVAVTDLNLYFYRINQNGITGQKFNTKRLDALGALEERKKFYLKNGEKELYEMAVNSYMAMLVEYYFKIKENVDDSEKHLENIRKETNKNVKEILKIRNINWKVRLLYQVFSISPNLYSFLVEVIRNIK